MAAHKKARPEIEVAVSEENVINLNVDRKTVPPYDPIHPVTVRLYQSAMTGDSEYHVDLPLSKIRALLRGEEDWIVLPDRYSHPSYSEARLVNIQAVAELHIVGVSSDMQWLTPPEEKPDVPNPNRPDSN